MKEKKGKNLAKFDRIDRYKAHLVDGLELNETEQKMLDRYRFAAMQLRQGMTRGHIVAALQREFDISEPQAYVVLRDGVKVYGDAGALDRQAMRQAMYDQFMLLAQLARRKEDFMSAARHMENAGKLFDLFKADVAGVDPSKYQRPANILFTDDESALKEAKEREQREFEGEDADFEVVE